MAEAFIFKNLADKRKEIQAYIGSLERDLEQARGDLSAIVATERLRRFWERTEYSRNPETNRRQSHPKNWH